MNIFATSICPFLSAKYQCNKHAVRQPLETAGMLVFAFPENETPIPNPRSNRHYKHPSSLWARQSKENFEWLLLHGLAQCEEYTRRYKREHDSEKHIKWCEKNYSFLSFGSKGQTPFARCFSQYKEKLDSTINDPVEAYREFYRLDKKDFAKWPSRKHIPDWWIDDSEIWVDKNFKNGVYTKR